ncbi:hypothetical protein AQUSIP_07410 [Aquicella siphonis]|uniref:Uncharacterized protein n=1 Tax=Aquicella siphonis TaxID=254247 RepID=A0A5E4PGK5_9COXI|nr:motile sperm domain-containing protein [Aquicella siphonis]VVC75451.1 hypothetical protein AQUSIP_07410 [Aquicella siphonis]
MKAIRHILPVLFSCIALSAYANTQADENSTLHVTLTNHTHDQLRFDRVTSSRPGSHFSVYPETINPGETTIVTVEKLSNNDIQGMLAFTSANGDEAVLFILDQEQIHFGQPVFHFSGSRYASSLILKTRNRNIGPRYLTYIEARLNIVTPDIV